MAADCGFPHEAIVALYGEAHSPVWRPKIFVTPRSIGACSSIFGMTAGHSTGMNNAEQCMSTTKTKFLYLYRFPAGAAPKPSSPEEMQAQYAAWTA